MKLALIGYGVMGKLIERLAVEQGHEIGAIIDDSDATFVLNEIAQKLRGCDVAIDFTVGSAVRQNVEACIETNVPIVVGTTGWSDERPAIEQLINEADGALIFGANFSIGVNLFYKIAEYAAQLFAKFPEYEAFIEEQHHSRKKDAPSGTALKLKEVVEKHVEVDAIAATRAGGIPGTHRLGFDSAADQILLEHSARSREGFALGAIRAAEWIVGKRGFYEFTDVLESISK